MGFHICNTVCLNIIIEIVKKLLKIDTLIFRNMSHIINLLKIYYSELSKITFKIKNSK